MLTFIGDIFWDSHRELEIAPSVEEAIKKSKLVCCNLEGGLGSAPGDYQIGSRLNFDMKIAEILNNIGVSTVSVANNHALDAGYIGLQDLAKLDTFGISFFGTACKNYHEIKTKHHQIVLLSYCDDELYAGSYNHNYDTKELISLIDYREIYLDISKFKGQNYKVVVQIHAGGEFEQYPGRHIRNLFRFCIDVGADVVIGHHPHVAQECEEYKEGLICYSLGNFVMTHGVDEKACSGKVLSIDFTDEGIKKNEICIVQETEDEVVRIKLSKRCYTNSSTLLEKYRADNVTYTHYLNYIFSMDIKNEYGIFVKLKLLIKSAKTIFFGLSEGRRDLLYHLLNSDHHHVQLKKLSKYLRKQRKNYD